MAYEWQNWVTRPATATSSSWNASEPRTSRSRNSNTFSSSPVPPALYRASSARISWSASTSLGMVLVPASSAMTPHRAHAAPMNPQSRPSATRPKRPCRVGFEVSCSRCRLAVEISSAWGHRMHTSAMRME